MKDYHKYRWFYTSAKTLVIGGKNAEQNDALLKEILADKQEYIVMHTSAPGSPFSIILKDVKKVTKEDLEQCAVFTGCFSRAWREGKKTAVIDIFKTRQISKSKDMKAGMWRVTGRVERVKVELKLAITLQKKILRAVPLASATKKLMIVCPGKVDKSDMAAQIGVELGNSYSHDELIAALPAGGVRKCT